MIADQTLQHAQLYLLAGLGREGRSSYDYFSRINPTAHWVISDEKALSVLDVFWQELIRKEIVNFAPLDELESELTKTKILPENVVLIKTAGLPIEHPALQTLVNKGLMVTSNTAAFFAALTSLTPAPITIGVTGTKGKSTTTSMIAHVLKTGGLPVVVAGNIGVPPLSTLDDPVLKQVASGEQGGDQQPVIVLELSSHQLRELQVSPHIAVILDITPEHLDYYSNFEQYLEAKAPITTFQTVNDSVVFDPSFAIPSQLAARSLAKKVTFSLHESVTQPQGESPRAYLKDDWLWYLEQRVIAVKDVPLLGRHNLLNTLPAILIAVELFGLEPEVVANSIKSFVGLPHRLEFAGDIRGVRYYNDSQATTPEASIAAITSFPDTEIILLAGGSDKGVSFDNLATEILQQKIIKILLFPPMGAAIKTAVQAAAARSQTRSVPTFQEVGSMSEAVQAAAATSSPGSVVLLSPACASFGMFENYQDRGNQFKAAVARL